MRHRSKMNKKRSKKLFRKTSRPILRKFNKGRPGLKRGGTRL